jgi:hypothetical protein
MRRSRFSRRQEQRCGEHPRPGLVLGLGLVLMAGVVQVGCASPVDGTEGTDGEGGTGAGSGGSRATGGMTGSGGVTGTGGMTGDGGATGSGGARGSGGLTGSGGATGSGGLTGSGGRTGSGGAGGRGGATGSGGMSGTGGAATGGAGGSTCAFAPVDPQATSQARNLLCYLHSISGNHVLSGQQETSWSNPAGDITYYVTNVGKYPAILGGDYLYPSGTTSRAQAYWQAGGLTMMRYHMGAPPLSDTFANAETATTSYANVLTSGTTENASLLSKLDYLAGELKTLQNANVAVILALYHEVQPNGWFWWAMGTGPQFVQLWQLSFNYLTQTKGIHNVIWLLPFSGSPSAAYYPGKAWVDISGPDEYSMPNTQPFTSNYKAAVAVLGSTIPIPLHETGAVPQPASMFPSTAPWLLWNVWATYENTPQNGTTFNTVSSLQSAYASTYTITRDLLPKF